MCSEFTASSASLSPVTASPPNFAVVTAASATSIKEVSLPGLITYISALEAGAVTKVILFISPDPSAPIV